MSAQIHVVAILNPAPRKEARLRGLLTNLANIVKDEEPEVSRYQLFEEQNAQGGNVFVVEECYESKAAFDVHFKTEQFTALGEAIQKEGLVTATPDIKIIKSIDVFSSR